VVWGRKADMSTPISATTTSATTRPMPGVVSRRVICSSKKGCLQCHLLVEAPDCGIELVDVVEVQSGHAGVVLPEASLQRQVQLWDL